MSDRRNLKVGAVMGAAAEELHSMMPDAVVLVMVADFADKTIHNTFTGPAGTLRDFLLSIVARMDEADGEIPARFDS